MPWAVSQGASVDVRLLVCAHKGEACNERVKATLDRLWRCYLWRIMYEDTKEFIQRFL